MTSVTPAAAVDLQKQAVDTLHQAIKMLFPDPNPDIYTLDNFRFQFKLRTGLENPVVRAIEKSQRINRRSGNYRHAGLCEFHIGLIYLDAADYRGARQQFAQARQQWSFVHEPAAETLALTAEGVAQHLAHHHEAAMACYHKANQSLPRVRFALPAHYKDKVYELLAEQIEFYQTLLRTQLWPDSDELATAVSPHPTTPLTPPIQPQPVSAEAPPQRPDAESEKENGTAAPPIINFETDTTPIPAHQYLGEQYEWFSIDKQPEVDFFPLDVQQGGWVLVDKQPSLRTGELILVWGREDYGGYNGRLITVSPVRARSASRIYLAWLDSVTRTEPQENNRSPENNQAQFYITISPDIEQIAVQLADIVGIVVGFWLPVQIR